MTIMTWFMDSKDKNGDIAIQKNLITLQSWSFA